MVVRHGHVALLSAVGYRDLETKAPMRTDTVFRIFSMTKPMTGTAAMILVEDGRIAIIDPVEKYLPEFKGQLLKSGGKPAHPITLFEILNHTSGIQEPPKGLATLAEGVAASAKQPLEFEPGTMWRYRTAGINAAGRVVEAVSGMPYEKFMAARIFEPLGMKDTGFTAPKDASRLAVTYTFKDGKVERTANPAMHTYPEPGAGAYSTAEDLARFYQMILNGGTLNGRRILGPDAIRFMTSNHTGDLKAGFAPGQGYGMGWGVTREAKGSFRLSSVGSFGHGGAYRTYGWVDPAKDMFTVLLMQRTNEGGDIADEINAFVAMSAAAIEK
jgi:CubicO group peptidase (beta-lactamase class C family)